MAFWSVSFRETFKYGKVFVFGGVKGRLMEMIPRKDLGWFG